MLFSQAFVLGLTSVTYTCVQSMIHLRMHAYTCTKQKHMHEFIHSRDTLAVGFAAIIHKDTHATDTEKERESQDAHAYEHARAHAYERAHAHTRTQTVLHTLGTGRLPRVSWPFRTAVSTADNGRAFQASNMA